MALTGAPKCRSPERYVGPSTPETQVRQAARTSAPGGGPLADCTEPAQASSCSCVSPTCAVVRSLRGGWGRRGRPPGAPFSGSLVSGRDPAVDQGEVRWDPSAGGLGWGGWALAAARGGGSPRPPLTHRSEGRFLSFVAGRSGDQLPSARSYHIVAAEGVGPRAGVPAIGAGVIGLTYGPRNRSPTARRSK